MKAHRAPSSPPRASPWRLRFILLGGGTAWFGHLVFAYLIAEFGVLTELHRTMWSGISAVVWLIAGLSVLMFLFAALAAGAAWNERTRAPSLVRDEEDVTHAGHFCLRFGLATNLAFAAIIAVQTIPIFYFLRP